MGANSFRIHRLLTVLLMKVRMCRRCPDGVRNQFATNMPLHPQPSSRRDSQRGLCERNSVLGCTVDLISTETPSPGLGSAPMRGQRSGGED